MAAATPIAARSQASRRRRENNGSGAGGWVQHAQRFHLSVQENSWNHTGALFQKRPIISLDGSGNKKGPRKTEARFKMERQNGAASDASSASLEAAEPEASVSGSGSPRSSLRTLLIWPDYGQTVS